MNCILTNGCFDLFHAGHAHFLMELKKRVSGFEDRLVVFLNTDESIFSLKGASRPVMSFDERKAMVLHWADEVIAVEGLTCEAELANYTNVVTADFTYAKEASAVLGRESLWAMSQGLPILLIPRLPGISTTDIIERIQSRATQQANVSGQGRDIDPRQGESHARQRDLLVAGSSSSTKSAPGYGLRAGDSYKSGSYRPEGVFGGSAAGTDPRVATSTVGRRRRDD